MKIQLLKDFGFLYEGKTIHGMWFSNKANAQNTLYIQAILGMLEAGEGLSLLGELAGAKVKDSDYNALCSGSLSIEIAPEEFGGGYMILFPSCPIINESKDSSSDTSGNKGCFVATACYGSYDCDEVVTLRKFRDNVLLKRKAGRAFVQSYYTISPPISRWLRKHCRIANIIRQLFLSPIVNIINAALCLRR